MWLATIFSQKTATISTSQRYSHVSVSDVSTHGESQSRDSRIDSNDDSHVSISVLPSIKTSDIKIKKHQLMNIILAWIALVVAVVSGSAIGPTFKYMESVRGISPILAATWRLETMTLWLIPFAAIESLANRGQVEKVPWFSRQPGLLFPVIVHVFIAGILWAINLVTWIIGLQYTTTGRPTCRQYKSKT